MGPADGPARVLLLALMLAVTVYHLEGLARGRGSRRVDVDAAHAFMGAVMAVMLAKGIPATEAGLLAVLFGAVTGWFVVRAVHAYVMAGAGAADPWWPQAVPGAAMVYMLALAAAPRHGGMVMPASPTALAWLMVAALVLGTVSPGKVRRPSLDAGCRIAMSATACIMLLAT